MPSVFGEPWGVSREKAFIALFHCAYDYTVSLVPGARDVHSVAGLFYAPRR